MIYEGIYTIQLERILMLDKSPALQTSEGEVIRISTLEHVIFKPNFWKQQCQNKKFKTLQSVATVVQRLFPVQH